MKITNASILSGLVLMGIVFIVGILGIALVKVLMSVSGG